MSENHSNHPVSQKKKSAKAKKRRAAIRRRNRILVISLLALIFCVLLVFLLFRKGKGGSDTQTSVVLYKTVEVQPSGNLNADDLIQDNPDMASITLENMPEKDASGNYPAGEYQVQVLADGKPAGTVTVRVTESAPADGQQDSQDMQNAENGSAADAGNSSGNSATYVNGILISNKKHPLPEDFNPGNDPQAESQVQRLIADMQAQGLDVQNTTSGFRDYAYQKQLYDGYVAQYGVEEADRISARPGYSEHQTGLTHDLISNAGELITSEPEATWIREHCADYGFIVRYPEGKEAITGYDYEPWHLRYVGNPAAEEIMSKGITLEEYLNVEGGDYADQA